MKDAGENEIKKEFHLERIIFFSDALFAIIITIMILDVKLPELAKNAGEAESKKALWELLGKVVAYGVSFTVIGSFWMRHMRIYSFVKDFNKELLVLNLLFLFGVSLFPFALSFWFSSSVIKQYSWGIYTFVGIGSVTLLVQDLLIGSLIKNKEELCIRQHEIETALRWKTRRLNIITIPFVIILMIVSSYFKLQEYFVYGNLILSRVVISKLNRKYYTNYKQERINITSLLGYKRMEAISKRRKQIAKI